MNTFISDTAERSRPYRFVGVAAILLTAVAVGVMFTVNANRPRPTGGVQVGATSSPSAWPVSSPDATPVPSASPSPATSPNPSPSVPPAASSYVCGTSTTFTAKQPPLSAYVDAVRIGAHTGYDRVVIEFQNGQAASIKLQPQAGTSFTRDGIGDTVQLAGNDGLLVSMFSADAHTAYSGPTDIKTGFTGLLEVRKVGDFEGYVHWGLGLTKPACYNAFILTNPTRLVIDIQTS
jgi:hypothetical protein